MLVYIPTSLFPDVMYGECLNNIQIQLEHSLNSCDINGRQWIRLSGDFKFCLHEIHPLLAPGKVSGHGSQSVFTQLQFVDIYVTC